MKYLLVCMLTVLSFNIAAEQAWDVDEILTKLKSNQAIEFVNSIKPGDDWKVFDNLLKRIESGDPKWLEVGVILEDYTDAGISMGLSIAFAQAIKNNPEVVLAIMSEYDVSWSCSVPLIEPTKDVFDYFVNSTLSAVNKMDSPKLAMKKDTCLKKLNEAKERHIKAWAQ